MSEYKNMAEVIKEKSRIDDRGVTFILGENQEEYISYKSFFKEAMNTLYNLQKKEIKQGDKLIFQLENNRDFLRYFFACILGGIIPIPIAVGKNEEHRMKLLRIWNILDNVHMVTDYKEMSALEKFLIEKDFNNERATIKQHTVFVEENIYTQENGTVYDASPEDIAFIQFSSGSTGDPKGVVLTHKNILTNNNQACTAWEISESDRALSWMPLTHDMGLILVFLTNVYKGAAQYIMPTALFVREPTLWMKKASEHKITMLYSPNFGYKYFLTFYVPHKNNNLDLSHIRLISNGAEPISVELCHEFLDKLSDRGLKKNSMLASYGLAEGTVLVSCPPVGEDLTYINLDRKHLGIGQTVKQVSDNTGVTFVDIGHPVKGCNIRICDEENNVLPDNAVGYIQISGYNVTKGYYNNKRATEKVITGEFLNTGDLGFLNNGRLTVTGRAKDVIFVNGQNYYSHDIERVAMELEGIELGKIVACGIYNELRQQEEIIIFVMHKRKPEEFVSFVEKIKNHLGHNMGIDVKDIVPIKKIPKTTSGKVQRYKLGEMYKNGEFDIVLKQVNEAGKEPVKKTGITVSSNELEKNLMEIFKKVFGVDEVGVDEEFLMINSNSLLLTQIAGEIDKIYPAKVEVKDLFACYTISKLAKYIEETEKIILPAIKMPDDFLNGQAGIGKGNGIIEFQIDKSISDDINIICREIEADKEDFLLLGFICLFNLVTGSKHIPLQIMFENMNDVSSINFNFDKSKNIDILMNEINFMRKINNTGKCYSLNNLNKIKHDGGILPLLYNKKLLGVNIELLDFYDFMAEMVFRNNLIEIMFCFNEKKFKKAKIKEFANSYVNVLKHMVGTFEKTAKKEA